MKRVISAAQKFGRSVEKQEVKLTSDFLLNSHVVNGGSALLIYLENPYNKNKASITMGMDDDPDEIAEEFLNDEKLGIPYTEENHGHLANAIEDLWY